MEKQKLSSILKIVSLASASLAAVLQTVAMLVSYDARANYFLVWAPLPYIAVALTILAAVSGLLFAILGQKPKNTSPFSKGILPSIPAALGMLVCTCLIFIFADGTLATVTAICLILAALYSVLCGTAVQKNHPSILCLLGFATVLAGALMNVLYYFDPTLEMNAPIKITVQTALLFAMIYYTAELRYLLEREKPRVYLALSLMTIAASALPAVSIPVAYTCGIITRVDCLAGAILTLGIAITVALRLYTIFTAKADTDAEAEFDAEIKITEESVAEKAEQEEEEAE